MSEDVSGPLADPLNAAMDSFLGQLALVPGPSEANTLHAQKCGCNTIAGLYAEDINEAGRLSDFLDSAWRPPKKREVREYYIYNKLFFSRVMQKAGFHVAFLPQTGRVRGSTALTCRVTYSKFKEAVLLRGVVMETFNLHRREVPFDSPNFSIGVKEEGNHQHIILSDPHGWVLIGWCCGRDRLFKPENFL